MTLRAQKVDVVSYDAGWPARFAALAADVRRALGDQAVRIDHQGSTAVPGLAAKPIIDIQVSVAALDPVEQYGAALEAIGYRAQPDNDDRTKRFFFRPVDHAANLHVRVAGSFSEQVNLLFRDYLRTHPEAAAHYGAVKQGLAGRLWSDVDEYAAAKSGVVWALVHEAYLWSMGTGWQPGPSDA